MPPKRNAKKTTTKPITKPTKDTPQNTDQTSKVVPPRTDPKNNPENTPEVDGSAKPEDKPFDETPQTPTKETTNSSQNPEESVSVSSVNPDILNQNEDIQKPGSKEPSVSPSEEKTDQNPPTPEQSIHQPEIAEFSNIKVSKTGIKTLDLVYFIVCSFDPLLKSYEPAYFFSDKNESNNHDLTDKFISETQRVSFSNAMKSFGYRVEVGPVQNIAGAIKTAHTTYSIFIVFFKKDNFQFVFWNTKYDWKYIIINENEKTVRRISTTSLIDTFCQNGNECFSLYVKKKYQ